MNHPRILFLLSFTLTLALGELHADPEVLKIDGSNGARPLITALTQAIQQRKGFPTISLGDGMKTGERLSALDKGEIDLATASHGIEADKLAPYDFEVFRIADMAVVFAAHKSVALPHSLSSEDIVAIYSGKKNNWAELGGPDLPIVRLMRPEDEVDTEIIRREVKGMAQLRWAMDTKIHANSRDLARDLASTPGAIGVTTLIRANNNESITVLPLDSFEPNQETVRNGSYTLTRGIFLVAPKKPTTSALQFLYFAGSAEGRALLSKNHSIPCGLSQLIEGP